MGVQLCWGSFEHGAHAFMSVAITNKGFGVANRAQYLDSIYSGFINMQTEISNLGFGAMFDFLRFRDHVWNEINTYVFVVLCVFD